MKGLTKKQVSKMTSEELQETRAQLVGVLTTDISSNDKNIINGSIDMIDVELSKKQPKITADANGEGSIVDYTNNDENGVDVQMENNDKQVLSAEEEQKQLDASPSVQIPSTLAGAMDSIAEIMAAPGQDNIKLARIMKIAEANVDYAELPYDLCSDAELLRRLKLVWSKKVAAKKAGKLAELADLEKQEELLNSYREPRVQRSNTVSSDNVDHSKLSQLDLQKLIRNYQSKKSMAKKIYEAAIAEGDAAKAEENKNLMEHWQAKVDDASKYRTGSTNQRTTELTKQVQETLAMLKMLPQSDEIAAKIKQLEALL